MSHRPDRPDSHARPAERAIVIVPATRAHMTATPASGAPSLDSFEAALALAEEPETLQELDHKAAVLQALVSRMRLALEEQNRVASLRLEIGRKLGSVLAARVRRGGRGSRSPDATSNRGGSSAPLPPGISKHQAARWRQLAAVPSRIVELYLEAARRDGQRITADGLRRFALAMRRGGATPAHRAPGPPRPATVGTSTWPEFLGSLVTRVMRRAALHIGDASGIPADHHRPDALPPLPDPPPATACITTAAPLPWLRHLTEIPAPGRTEILLAFPVREPDWTRHLPPDHCAVCAGQGHGEQSHVVVYHGSRRHAFVSSARAHGAVIQRLGRDD